MADTPGGIKAEVEASFGNFMKVILEILLPIALFFIGLAILAPTIGLSGFYSGLLANAPIPGTATTVASSGAAILTYLGIGGGFIMVERTYDGWFGDIVGAIGWMAVGAGLREILAFLMSQAPLAANGFLSKAANSLTEGINKAANGN